MALIDLIPVMTSNNPGNGYIASASSSYSPNYLPYKAFDKVKPVSPNNNCWSTEPEKNILTGWLQITFPSKTKVSRLELMHRNVYPEGMVKEFKLLGSNDNSSFTEIIHSIETGWQNLETRGFNFDPVEYKHYRLSILSNNGWSICTSIGEMSLLYNTDYDENISHIKSNLTYTLPMNTTINILNKINDAREGLLGMANDNDNYGDLYVVGKDGKSHLTKSGTKSEIIWEGVCSTTNVEMILNKSIQNYKYILFEITIDGQTNFKCCEVIPINNVTQSYNVISSKYNTTSSFWYTSIFVNERTFKIESINYSGLKPVISKVIGIY